MINSGNSGHSFRGKARVRRTKRAFSQAIFRRAISLTDQHGRPWTAHVGIKTGMPIGSIEPSFSAPWYPDQQYLRMNPDNQSELFIDYDALYLRRETRAQQFHRLAVARARQKSMEVPARGVYPPELIAVCGGMPKPIEPVVAAMQSNPWILGFTDVADPRLEPFVTKSRQIIQLEKTGMDFSPRTYADAVQGTEAAVAYVKSNIVIPGAVNRTVTAVPIESANLTVKATPIAKWEASKPDDTTEDDLDAFDGMTPTEGDDDLASAYLQELEDEVDPDAVGGKTVAHQKVAQAPKRVAPKRPTTGPKKSSNVSTSARRAAQARSGKRTLAQGAAPVIASGGL